MERGLLRHAIDAMQQFGGARPADLHTGKQIGFGARHLEQAFRIEVGLLAEDLRIGLEAHAGAAPVGDLAELFQPALRLAALIDLPIELTAARHFDFEPLG